jgi:hypothetical protein
LRQVQAHLDEFGSGYAGHFLAAVPEPSSVASTVFGLSLAMIRRRRSRRQRSR